MASAEAVAVASASPDAVAGSVQIRTNSIELKPTSVFKIITLFISLYIIIFNQFFYYFFFVFKIITLFIYYML